ncbi:hypothetical protein DPMN_130328 [Dreissena polymorpha]|uniref:Uncharacterized protein n=1 Tax=Dreissena polymorpha TaxID=45954 RepID=A0A9D4H4H6_DREPO|nr:hypothetical protein DPMN_130328 [Dreissena polymorpha]
MSLELDDVSSKMVALSCDGASVMLGCKAGVGALLQKEQPSLIKIHCMAYRLELSLKDMAESTKFYVKTVDSLLLGLYLFYHYSSLNRSMLNRSYEALKTTEDGPLLMPVRWRNSMDSTHLASSD